MPDNTAIEWCDATWNPITGCAPAPISPGCANCYARRMANRLRGRFGYDAVEPFKPTCHPDKLNEPLRWKRPRKVFVCSMGDFWHATVHPVWRGRVCRTMIAAPHHQYLMLTKRPENVSRTARVEGVNVVQVLDDTWLGVSVESQEYVHRIDTLCERWPGRKFVSIEPMLGPVEYDWSRVDWVIVGGETGRVSRRPFCGWIDAVVSVYRSCEQSGTPFFFKKMPDRMWYVSSGPIPWQRREFPKELEVIGADQKLG